MINDDLRIFTCILHIEYIHNDNIHNEYIDVVDVISGKPRKSMFKTFI